MDTEGESDCEDEEKAEVRKTALHPERGREDRERKKRQSWRLEMLRFALVPMHARTTAPAKRRCKKGTRQKMRTLRLRAQQRGEKQTHTERCLICDVFFTTACVDSVRTYTSGTTCMHACKKISEREKEEARQFPGKKAERDVVGPLNRLEEHEDKSTPSLLFFLSLLLLCIMSGVRTLEVAPSSPVRRGSPPRGVRRRKLTLPTTESRDSRPMFPLVPFVPHVVPVQRDRSITTTLSRLSSSSSILPRIFFIFFNSSSLQ